MKDIGQGQSFVNFTLRNRIYIDKTEQISKLLKTDRVFISRPRRFGKSLMLDTIGTLFEYGVDPYFKGTWIYDKWTEEHYPVLRLNFLDYNSSDYNGFFERLGNSIRYFASNLNLAGYIHDHDPSNCLISLFNELDKAEKMIVILIDEYDAQLTANINNEELYKKYQEKIRDLYGVIKGKSCIRFLCVTGVTRLKDVSIFSVGSDILDKSYSSPVSTITGFTREEIRKYYIDYIDLAVSLDKGISEEQVTEQQRDELLSKLAVEYDGYCFDDEYNNKVFSTWSVNNFFAEIVSRRKVKFGDYWYANGGLPSILAKYLETHTLRPEDYSADIDVGIDHFMNPTSLLNMKQEVLMCQTGYLTVHSTVPNGNSVRLGVPNREVRRALEKRLSQAIFRNENFPRDKIETIFHQSSADEIVGYLNSLMNTVSYEDYSNITEKTVQGMLHAFFIGADQPVRTEVQSATGRSDIVLEYENRRVVFELKYAENEADCEALLREAVNQIRTRRFGDQLAEKALLQIPLVFNGDKTVRQFRHYEVVEQAD